MPERREVDRVTPGAARCVERNAHGKAVEDLPHDRLLDLEQLVPGLVVGRRPERVALARRDRAALDAVAELVGPLEQRGDLAKALERERPVVRARERTQEREPLEPEEVRERVLVDHGWSHLPPRMIPAWYVQRSPAKEGRCATRSYPSISPLGSNWRK